MYFLMVESFSFINNTVLGKDVPASVCLFLPLPLPDGEYLKQERVKSVRVRSVHLTAEIPLGRTETWALPPDYTPCTQPLKNPLSRTTVACAHA